MAETPSTAEDPEAGTAQTAKDPEASTAQTADTEAGQTQVSIQGKSCLKEANALR